jgi:hypothetical protein
VTAKEWFKKGGTVDVGGKAMTKSLVTDIAQGEIGDIVFMGEDGEMKGHAVLLEKLEVIDSKTIKMTAYGAYVPDNDYKIGREEHTFVKDAQGKWINTTHGGDYEFKGYGQLSEN